MTWFIEQLHRDGYVLSRKEVVGNELCIGRALDNDFVVDDPHCAAYHATLHINVEDGGAVLQDLGTRNGIAPQRGSSASSYRIENDQPYRIGQTTIRIRSTAWPLHPEKTVSLRAVWPFAIAALALVLMHTTWEIWLLDVNEKSPPYLFGLVGAAVGLVVWSGMYALLGRLIGGVDRFFTHLLIAASGYLGIMLVDKGLELLAFAMDWLWPERIAIYVTVLLVALLVRAHLRAADPRHWPVMRWAVGLAASLAVMVPLAQSWILNQRLTKIQALSVMEHPAVRLAQPISLDALAQAAVALKVRVDKSRTDSENSNDWIGDTD
jgi:FHA domain